MGSLRNWYQINVLRYACNKRNIGDLDKKHKPKQYLCNRSKFHLDKCTGIDLFSLSSYETSDWQKHKQCTNSDWKTKVKVVTNLYFSVNTFFQLEENYLRRI